jgi:hypothetical protein
MPAIAVAARQDEVARNSLLGSLQKNKKHKNTVTAYPRARVEIRSFMTVAIIKDGQARIIIMHPETILRYAEAGYICADFFSSNLILVAFGWRTRHVSTVDLSYSRRTSTMVGSPDRICSTRPF